jgi:NAD(P)-dependent dehydrogenase (short-subunit alcohol dehydrogenase family)
VDLGLRGKTAIVTGGSLGIGRAVCIEFAREGANVVSAARSERNLADTVRLGANLPGRILPVPQDCSAANAAEHVVGQALQAFGGVDILVNNLGTGTIRHDWQTGDAAWQDLMNLNLYSAVRFTRACVPEMQKRASGRIINMASVSGHSGLPRMGPYNASKAAMIMWSKTISRELGPKITVNTISAGCIDTPLWESLATQLQGELGSSVKEVYANVAREHLVMDRYGTPEEVAGLCVFLASERAAFITGAMYNIDGGFTDFAF